MAKDWSIYRDEIEALYVTHGKTLQEVRRVLKGTYNFDASTRAYRMKLEGWGVKKNRTTSRSSHPVRTLHSTQNSTAARNWQSTSFAGSQSAHLMDISHTEGPPAIIASHRSLFDIIGSGAEEEFYEALSSGASIHVQDHLGNYPLHAAVLKGNIGMTQALFRYGANVDAIGQKGKAALHLAVSSTEMLPVLLQHQPKLSLQDEDGNTILHHIILIPNWWNDLVCIKAIESVLSSGVDINIANHLGESSLHRLVARIVPESLGYMNIVSGFLNYTTDVTTPMRNAKPLFTTFLERSDVLDHDIEQDWVKAGFRCLEQFLNLGADPNVHFRSQRFVHSCLKHSIIQKGTLSENFLQILLQKADLDFVCNGDFPLHMALRHASDWKFPCYKVVSTLINQKIDVNQLNDFGASPLEIWLRTGGCPLWDLFTKVALLLCQKGASIAIPVASGETLFDIHDYKYLKLYAILAKELLKADIRFQQDNIVSDTGALPEWAEAWRSAQKQSCWYLAKAQLERLEAAPIRPRVHYFMGTAYLVIVERLLEIHRAELKRWLHGDAERDSVKSNYEEYGAILRDCREKKLEIDQSYLTFLVDIMHFYR